MQQSGDPAAERLVHHVYFYRHALLLAVALKCLPIAIFLSKICNGLNLTHLCYMMQYDGYFICSSGEAVPTAILNYKQFPF